MTLAYPVVRQIKALGAAFGIVLLVGCHQRSQQNTSTSGTPSGAVQTTSDFAPKPSLKRQHTLHLTVIAKGINNPFWQSVKRGALDAGKRLQATIQWSESSPLGQSDHDGSQLKLLTAAIEHKADGILLAPCNRNILAAAINQTLATHTPLVLCDTEGDSQHRIPVVATDNQKGGAIAAARLGAIAGAVGTVGVVPVQPNSLATQARELGFEEGLHQKFPTVKVVKSRYGYSDLRKSQSATEAMLQAHPEISAVFCPTEATTRGVLEALRKHNLAGKVKLVGFGSPEVMGSNLKNNAIDALLVQNPYQIGFKGIEALVQRKDGVPVPTTIDSGVAVVTKDNLNATLNHTTTNLK